MTKVCVPSSQVGLEEVHLNLGDIHTAVVRGRISLIKELNLLQLVLVCLIFDFLSMWTKLTWSAVLI